MKSPFETVNRFIERHSMLDGATGVVVAVSGGPDSVALLDMLARIGVRGRGLGVREDRTGERQASAESASRTNPQPLSPNSRLHVAHLDHKLRSRESAEDAEFVRALADRFGFAVTVNSVDVRAAAEVGGRGIEEIAREIRYDFLVRVASETGCDRIAVGHTMTDQAETFLMRLIRGAGLRGLAAMRPIGHVPVAGDQANCSRGAEEQGSRGDLSSSSPLLRSPSPLLIRPLLCIAREGVEAYCRERGLEFRTDETNRSLLYTRNRIRNEVLPALSIINPRVVESIARAAEHLADDQDALNCMALSLLEAARVDSSAELHPADGSAAAYSVPALLEQPAGMQRRMIIEALRRARTAGTPGAHAAAGETISAHARAIEALFEPKASGKHITLPGGLEVWREFDLVVFKAKTLALETPPYQYSISATCPNVEAGGFLFTLRRGLPGQSLESVIEENRRKKERSGKDWIIVALDDQALPERLIIRPRRRGERAHVVGQRKTIKLKNLMIDHRIPSSRRANWPIVAIPDGCYVWSPGLPPSLDFAARDEAHGLATMRASAI